MVNTLFKDVAMTDDGEDEDEVIKKKKVSKQAKKKTQKKATKKPPKETKKVTKKIVKKKNAQKKRSIARNIKTPPKAGKDVKVGSVNYETVGLFGVAKGVITFYHNNNNNN